jgi:hypothetical protein
MVFNCDVHVQYQWHSVTVTFLYKTNDIQFNNNNNNFDVIRLIYNNIFLLKLHKPPLNSSEIWSNWKYYLLILSTNNIIL